MADKVGALYPRAQTRDYIDVYAALRSGCYSGDVPFRLAAEHDPGFDAAMVADALRAGRRLPLAEFAAYELGEVKVSTCVGCLVQWAEAIDQRRTP